MRIGLEFDANLCLVFVMTSGCSDPFPSSRKLHVH